MSRYPPPPLFGVPFSPNGQFAPSKTVPYPSVSNFLFYQSPDPSHQGHAPQTASFANNHPFNVISHNMNVPTSRPGVPQLPFSGFGQMTSGSFPPPSYPSIQPPPFNSFSHPHLPPPPLLQRETPSTSVPTRVSLPLKLPPATSPTALGRINDTPMSTAPIIELEDGEVSDRDGGRSSGNLPDPVASAQFQPADLEQEAISGKPIIPGVGKDIGDQSISDIRTDEGIQYKSSPPSKITTDSFEPADSHHSSACAPNRHSPVANKSNHFERCTNNELEKSILQGPTASSQPQVEGRFKDAPPAGFIPGTAVRDGKLTSSFLLSLLII